MALWDHLWVCVAREEMGWDGSWLARWEKHEFKVLPSAESRKQAAEGNQCMYDILAACCSCDADAAYLPVSRESSVRPSILSNCRSSSRGGLHFGRGSIANPP